MPTKLVRTPKRVRNPKQRVASSQPFVLKLVLQWLLGARGRAKTRTFNSYNTLERSQLGLGLEIGSSNLLKPWAHSFDYAF